MIPPSTCQPWQTDRSGPMPETTVTSPSYTTPWDTIHGRIDTSGRQRVYRNTERPEFPGQVLGKSDERRLRCGVMGADEVAVRLPSHRGDIDDPPRASGPHAGTAA